MIFSVCGLNCDKMFHVLHVQPIALLITTSLMIINTTAILYNDHQYNAILYNVQFSILICSVVQNYTSQVAHKCDKQRTLLGGYRKQDIKN